MKKVLGKHPLVLPREAYFVRTSVERGLGCWNPFLMNSSQVYEEEKTTELWGEKKAKVVVPIISSFNPPIRPLQKPGTGGYL